MLLLGAGSSSPKEAPHQRHFARAHEHPTETGVERYLRAGIPEGRLLRTDRGDNERGDEWADDQTPAVSCTDLVGDDDIVITLKADGSTPTVAYQNAHVATCP